MRFLCCTGELRIMCLLGAGVLACVRNSLQAVFVHCFEPWSLVALGGQSNALFCGVFLCGSKFHSCSRLHSPFSRISKPGLGFLSQFSAGDVTAAWDARGLSQKGRRRKNTQHDCTVQRVLAVSGVRFVTAYTTSRRAAGTAYGTRQISIPQA